MRPYSILMLILVLIMEILAIVGSITEDPEDDPTETSKIELIFKIYRLLLECTKNFPVNNQHN